MKKIISSIEEVLLILEQNSDPNSVEGMAKVGITTKKAYGVRIPKLKELAKQIGKNHNLAVKLWEIDSRETRILACMISDPTLVTEEQMDKWVKDFDNWELCDQCVMSLFDKTKFAHSKAFEWMKTKQEFIKRARFALVARFAWSDKDISNEKLLEFLPFILEEIGDERQTIKKAISWALRQIGKRNLDLNTVILSKMIPLKTSESQAARWIAQDVIADITRESIITKLKNSL